MPGVFDDIITVDSDAICAAMKDLFEDVRAVAEPSGALALAGMKKYIALHNIRGERLAHILSGANVNFHGLRYVSERCELGEQREALLAVTIPEEKAASSNSANCLAGVRSPSSTTVLPMPKTPASLSVCA